MTGKKPIIDDAENYKHRNVVDFQALLKQLEEIRYYGKIEVNITGGIPQSVRLFDQIVRLGIPEFSQTLVIIEADKRG